MNDAKVDVVNLLGRPLHVIGPFCEGHYPPDGRARVKSHMRIVQRVELFDELVIPVYVTEDTELLNLPPPENGKLYVVSGIVAEVARRSDVVAPGRVRRGVDGRIEGCQAFIRPYHGLSGDGDVG